MRIEQVELKNKGSLKFGDINIFVDPNNVGKTTLLQEMVTNYCEGDIGKYWIKSISRKEINEEGAQILLDLTEQIRTDPQNPQNNKYKIKIIRNGSGKISGGDNDIQLTQDDFERLSALKDSNQSKISNFEDFIKTPLLYRNFLIFEKTGERLNANGQFSPSIPLRPTDVYNYILNNDKFYEELNKKFFDVLGYYFYLLPHLRIKYEIGFSKAKMDEKIDIFKDYVDVEKWKGENDFVYLHEVGDGIRATANLFFSIYDPIAKIICIDEPEVFIYPSQKRRIANELKSLFKEKNKQSFIITHDTTFFLGLVDHFEQDIDTRIFYIKDKNSVVPLNFANDGSEVTPSTKDQKYLQMLFHKHVVFCEGPDDRYFYETVISSIYEDKISKNDIAFIDMGGADGYKRIMKLVKDAGMSSVFIFDLDVIVKKKYNIIELYNCLSGGSVESEVNSLYEFLKKEAEDNDEYKEGPKGIKVPNPSFFFTKYGIEEKHKDWYKKNRKHFDDCFNKLREAGIFIVPQGALESWAGNDDNFPYSAADAICLDNDLNNFKKGFSDKIIEFFE